MAGKRVAFLTRDGDFGTVDEAEAKQLPAGSRVLTAKEVAQREVDERYDALPTGQKVLGAVNTAVGALAGPLAIGHDIAAPPTLAAYGGGVRQGLTAGLYDAGARKFADAVGGKAAGDKFAAQREQEETASPTAHAAGELAGVVGGSMLGGAAGGAARALPSAGISALGDVVEQGVGRGLAGVAERGVAGRALASAAEMGARGAVEGGLFSAAQTAGDELLHDQELSADKIMAATGNGLLMGGLGGAALGGGGSLLKSGAIAAVHGLGDLSVNGSALRGAAQKASNELAFDALGATKGQAVNALEHVQGGAEAVGDYVNRIGIKPLADQGGFVGGSLKAGMGGRADSLLDAIQADKAGRIAPALENALTSTPARMSMTEQAAYGRKLYEDMLKDPTKIAGANAFLDRISLEGQAIENAGRMAPDGTIDAAQAFQLRSGMAKQVYELGRSSGAAGDAYKQYLRQWDRSSIQAIDEAAASAGKTGVGDDIRHWKREWQLASAAEELAEHGTDRVKLNAGISLRDTLHSGAGAHVGATAGGIIGGPAGAVVGGAAGGMAGALISKTVRERSAAAGAAALGKIADMSALTRLANKTTTEITAASRGLLTAPPKVAIPAPSGTPRVRAQQAMKLIASLQADPEGTTQKIAAQTEGIAATSPELANAIMQRHVQALTFLASKMPVAVDPDPIDPHPAPRMTDGDAATFARYAWYTEQPSRFFTEMAHGKITPEGAETAQALMPRAFAELQERTMDAIATHMARGRSIPFQQKLRIGTMLDIPADPSQQVGHAQLLQQNVLGSDQQSKAAPAKARSSPANTQRSSLDMLEANGPGRR